MRLENLRIELKNSVTIHQGSTDIKVRNPEDGSSITLPLWTEFLLSSFDGSVFFSDILRSTKAHEERGTKLREILEVVSTLAKSEFIENAQTIGKSIQSLLMKGSPSTGSPLGLQSDLLSDQEPEVVEFDEQRLIYYLRKTPLFSSNEDPYFKKLLKNSEVLSYKNSTKVIKCGEEARELYVLLEGRAGVFLPGGQSHPKFLALLQPVTVFGESAAALGKKRTADVITLDPSILLRLNLKSVLGPKEETSLTDFSSLRTRLLVHQLLFSTALFSGLPSEVFQLVLEKSSKVEVAPNQLVVQEGELDKSFYLILKGSLGVYRDGDRVASLQRGDHFGEIAALFNRPRNATLKAFTESILLKISQKDMLDFTCDHLSLGLHLEDVAIARLQSPRTGRSAGPLHSFSLENLDDLSNPFGSVHEDTVSGVMSVGSPKQKAQPLEIDELELDFNFDFSQRE